MKDLEFRKLLHEHAEVLGLAPAKRGWAGGKPDARIAIVGSYIGEHEISSGIPFSGGAGSKLWTALRKLGVERQAVWTTNVVKRLASLKVTKSGTRKLDIARGEQDQWNQLMLWELQQLPNVQVILVLGNEALEAIAGENKITNWRGSVLKRTISIGREVHLMCALNPAAIIYLPKDQAVFSMDMARFGRLLAGTYKEHKVIAHYNMPYGQAMNVLKELHREAIELHKPVSVDIETPGGQLGCVGLANDVHEGYCINFRTEDDHAYAVQEELALRQQIDMLLIDPKCYIVMQNASFDIGWLWYWDRIKAHCDYDTLLAHHLLYPTLPHNLGFLTTAYSEHPYYKDEGKAWREGSDIESHWEYNVKDCCITLAAYRGTKRELEKANLLDFFNDHVMRVQPHLIEMQALGIKVDADKRAAFNETLRTELASILEEFQELARELTGRTDELYMPNPNSPVQMSNLFFHQLSVKAPSTKFDKQNREYIEASHTIDPQVRKLCALGGRFIIENKFFGTYVETNLDEDNRMRCDYRMFGVQSAPGRLSSSATLWGSGGNLQNQPARAYPMFIADPGYCFVYFDLEQAEARFVGWDAGIAKWIKDFEYARLNPGEGFDCHRSLAADMFDMAYEDVPKEDRLEDGTITERFKGKRSRHGLNYVMGPGTLADSTGMSTADAIDAYRRYHEATPELAGTDKGGKHVDGWWDKVWTKFRKDRVLYNAYGRRLIAVGPIKDDLKTTVVAFKPQSSIGDKVNRCIYLCHEDSRWPIGEARIVLNIHDAIITLCKHEHKELVASIMKKHAEEPMQVNGKELIIPAAIKFSHPDEDGVHRWSTIH